LEETKEEKKKLMKNNQLGFIGTSNSILAMQKGMFNYQKELKALFNKAMAGSNK